MVVPYFDVVSVVDSIVLFASQVAVVLQICEAVAVEVVDYLRSAPGNLLVGCPTTQLHLLRLSLSLSSAPSLL